MDKAKQVYNVLNAKVRKLDAKCIEAQCFLEIGLKQVDEEISKKQAMKLHIQEMQALYLEKIRARKEKHEDANYALKQVQRVEGIFQHKRKKLLKSIERLKKTVSHKNSRAIELAFQKTCERGVVKQIEKSLAKFMETLELPDAEQCIARFREVLIQGESLDNYAYTLLELQAEKETVKQELLDELSELKRQAQEHMERDMKFLKQKEDVQFEEAVQRQKELDYFATIKEELLEKARTLSQSVEQSISVIFDSVQGMPVVALPAEAVVPTFAEKTLYLARAIPFLVVVWDTRQMSSVGQPHPTSATSIDSNRSEMPPSTLYVDSNRIQTMQQSIYSKHFVGSAEELPSPTADKLSSTTRFAFSMRSPGNRRQTRRKTRYKTSGLTQPKLPDPETEKANKITRQIQAIVHDAVDIQERISQLLKKETESLSFLPGVGRDLSVGYKSPTPEVNEDRFLEVHRVKAKTKESQILQDVRSEELLRRPKKKSPFGTRHLGARKRDTSLGSLATSPTNSRSQLEQLTGISRVDRHLYNIKLQALRGKQFTNFAKVNEDMYLRKTAMRKVGIRRGYHSSRPSGEQSPICPVISVSPNQSQASLPTSPSIREMRQEPNYERIDILIRPARRPSRLLTQLK